MDRFTAMRSFVGVVERGSFAAAAQATDLSAAMVGNHVRFLERRLGTPLIDRTTRRQSVTEVGRSYYERCRAILIDIEAADTSATAALADVRGLLRVTAPLSIGTTILPAVAVTYLKQHPAVRLDLVLSERRLDLLTDQLNVAIRLGPLPDSGLIARALPSVRLVLCASPAYLEQRGVPRHPDDLTEHECLGFFLDGPHVWRLTGPNGPVSVPVEGRLRIDNGQALRNAALAGMGIIMPPMPVVAEDLETGRLVPLLPDYIAPALPLHVLTLPEAATAPKVRQFIDLLVSALEIKASAG